MLDDVRFDHLPHFTPRRDKVLAAILLLLREGAKAGRALTRGEIVKSIFLADDRHLRELGRPVTFDNYVAMRRGPVGDVAIDMLRELVDWSELGLAGAPWEQTTFRGKPAYRRPAPEAGLDRLSPSDEEFLLAALADVSRAGFDATSELTHDHPAWSAAWSSRGEAKAVAMDWRLFPDADTGRIEDLVAAARVAA